MSRSSTPMASAAILMKQYKELTDPKTCVPSFHITLQNDDIYHWNIGVMVLAEDSPYNGGYFKARMIFPSDYPYSPPTFKFIPPIFHPNVYRDGRLCISILHKSGDVTSGEPDGETWSPVQTVESVLVSIVSLLSDPNINSPANVDASVAYTKNPEEFKQRVREEVERSKVNIPKGFVMPSTLKSAYVASKSRHDAQEDVVDDDFWYESEDSQAGEDDQGSMASEEEDENGNEYDGDEVEEEDEEEQEEDVEEEEEEQEEEQEDEETKAHKKPRLR
ncbi:uncharacterized protein SAPINGB_P004123 [Magnusiomyces paraingens]|uniref:UBC core domain-containing protein n=1 Tax=Magnusiomyces paraingens TaxID=2606893 RepID=A0A5E8BSV6_9ASCO|nr:uncharacterized protein SAPINGB_P004123 [Saprochaete ingens]VVT54533.1 unnamed protein product [Saprochaete ingens]